MAKENHTVQVSGTADSTANVVVSGATSAAARQGAYWSSEVGVNNGSAPWHGSLLAYVGKRGAGPNGTDLLRIDAWIASLAPALQHFEYDQDGNMTTDGIWTYTWDAENRLVSMSATVAAVASGMDNRVLAFRYDYLGRRIQKRIYDGGTNQLLSGRRFVYDGWNMIAEYADTGAGGPGAIIRSYAWGLDIARTLTEAGSVGALLSETDYATKKTFYATYDGNGNVAALISATSGAIAAAYEYSPFGEQLRAQTNDGTVAEQPFRFSTKYLDYETGLEYFGFRYYSSYQGRFLGRDPSGERGGLNLYASCLNDTVNSFDAFGLYKVPTWPPTLTSDVIQLPPFVVTPPPDIKPPPLDVPIVKVDLTQYLASTATGALTIYSMISGVSGGDFATLGDTVVSLMRRVVDEYKRTGNATVFKQQLKRAIKGNWSQSPNAQRVYDAFLEIAKYGGDEGEAAVVAVLSVGVSGAGGISNQQLSILDRRSDPGVADSTSGNRYLALNLSDPYFGSSQRYPDELPANVSIILAPELGHWLLGGADPVNVVAWENQIRQNYNDNGAPQLESMRKSYSGLDLWGDYT